MQQKKQKKMSLQPDRPEPEGEYSLHVQRIVAMVCISTISNENTDDKTLQLEGYVTNWEQCFHVLKSTFSPDMFTLTSSILPLQPIWDLNKSLFTKLMTV
jgi:hypothetical protein